MPQSEIPHTGYLANGIYGRVNGPWPAGNGVNRSDYPQLCPASIAGPVGLKGRRFSLLDMPFAADPVLFARNRMPRRDKGGTILA